MLDSDQFIYIIFGAILAIGQAAVLYRQTRTDKRNDKIDEVMATFIREIAELKVLVRVFDNAELARQRHRMNQLEIQQAKVQEEVEAIKERCALFHREDLG